MVKYKLIIEYYQKGNNNSQIATLCDCSRTVVWEVLNRFNKIETIFADIQRMSEVWSIVMGVFFAIAQKNEDKEKARKMIKNYVIGLVVIFAILVACPYLIKGIAALIAG